MGSVLLLALSLAVDAFAAAVCCGVRSSGLGLRGAARIGLWFGGFQAGMTLLGGLFGALLSRSLYRAGAVLSFGLLAYLGVKMLFESLFPGPEGTDGEGPLVLSAAALAPLALATSLDALAAGVSLGYLDGGLLRSAAVIGLVAFVLSALGGALGRRAGQRLHRWAGAAGGGVLLWLGLRVLAG